MLELKAAEEAFTLCRLSPATCWLLRRYGSLPVFKTHLGNRHEYGLVSVELSPRRNPRSAYSV